MSIRTVLFAALAPLVNQRVYPGTFPQEPDRPTWPSIRYSVIGGQQHPDQCGDDEATDDASVQVDCAADTYDAMVALKSAARTALLNTDPPCLCDGDRDDFDSETKTHRGILRMTFYPSSSA